MKILQLCNKFPYPPKDGGAIAVYNLAEGLSQDGHQVTILAMNTRKHFADPDEAAAAMKNVAELEYVNINTNINVLKAIINILFSRIPYNAERFIKNSFAGKIVSILNKSKFDIIQLEGLYLTPYIKTIRQYSEGIITLRAHNIEHEIWKRIADNEKNLFRKKYLKILAARIRRFETDSLNTYDLLLPITNRDAEILNNLGNRKPFKVIPAGINIERLGYSDRKLNLKSLFFIGSLDWIPNQEGLLWFLEMIWPNITAKNPGAEFFIAGRNAPKWLVKRISEYSNIVFMGEVQNAYEYMSDKAIMVIPLFSGSGMRVKIVEGMALGKVIVTTSTGAEGIDITHYENIIIADTAADFEKEILNLLDNRSFFTKIGENARKFVIENLDNKKITAQLAEFYKANLR